MPTPYDTFLSEVLATVPDDQREGFKAKFTDPSVVDKLQSAFLRQSDYSRSKDDLARRNQELDTFLAGERAKVEQWQQVYEESITTAAQQKELADKYRATYGDLKNDGTPNVGGMRKEDVEAMLKSEIGRERGALSDWMVDAVDKITSLKMNHAKDFGSDLSTKELTDFAAKHKINDLGIAYKAFVEPQLEAKREESFKAKMAEAVKQAHEEGKRSAIAERFPAGGSSRSLFPEAPKDAIITNDTDRIRSAAADLETMLAGMRG